MQTYDRVQGNETEAYIKARIFNGAQEPEAELHKGGPDTEGADSISGPMSVLQALERGKEIASENGVQFLIQMDGAAWDETWGMLRV
ncbi:hypothetical protein [Devosia sp. Naph2]|uniref:hypothetical protein n=1 Tax=Devosia polycyclovorans TaxID=3345148 RepID=UPI0035CF9B7B